MKTRKSWREKMEAPHLPKIVELSPKQQKRFGGAMDMVLPSPRDVDSVVRSVPEGETITVGEIRRTLAAKYGVATACPLVTGIFLRIISEAAEEEVATGTRNVTPYWRVTKDDGSLNPKFPGGIENQAEHLRAEGHLIVRGSGKLNRADPERLRGPQDARRLATRQ